MTRSWLLCLMVKPVESLPGEVGSKRCIVKRLYGMIYGNDPHTPNQRGRCLRRGHRRRQHPQHILFLVILHGSTNVCSITLCTSLYLFNALKHMSSLTSPGFPSPIHNVSFVKHPASQLKAGKGCHEQLGAGGRSVPSVLLRVLPSSSQAEHQENTVLPSFTGVKVNQDEES